MLGDILSSNPVLGKPWLSLVIKVVIIFSIYKLVVISSSLKETPKYLPLYHDLDSYFNK
jgi:hypothetical protein